MNSKVETTGAGLDVAKLTFAILIIVGAIVGFYYFNEYATVYRVLGLLLAAGVSIFIGLQTDKGREVWGYFHDAQIEVRKVVWPTRQETMQMTLLVILMVIIVALILWGLDAMLGWSISKLMSSGG